MKNDILNIITLLVNAAGAQFEDEQLAYEIIETNFKKLFEERLSMDSEAAYQCQMILEHFGRDAQINKLGEECSELSAVLFQRLCSTKDQNVVLRKTYSELADVYNLMTQMYFIFDDDKIRRIAKDKRVNCISENNILEKLKYRRK